MALRAGRSACKSGFWQWAAMPPQAGDGIRRTRPGRPRPGREREAIMIHHLMIRAAVLAAGASILAGGLAAPAAANGDFGQHVRTCAQTMGFGGEHNPGMHQGFHGWSPEHTC